MMIMEASGLTDVGRKRSNNEDAFAIRPELRLYVVADGMGGHSSGEVAAQIAVNQIVAFFEVQDLSEEATWPYPSYDDGLSFEGNKLRTAIALASEQIQNYSSEHPESRGMGTTVVAALVVGDRLIIGHVGDSRAYLYSGGQLSVLTMDHSWVSEQVRLGFLTEEEAAHHPFRNVITKALGTKDQAQADVLEMDVAVGDRILLCSDGLNSMAAEEDIARTLARRESLEATCRSLVELANQKGGEDNVTVILLERRA
ncbi:MAG: Stp1/IreP family PP2C-type Ser/Thr phosphatase [Acidobacteriota bacterium]